MAQSAEAIKATGRNLTAVYITHGHPDHYWGLTTLREAFPQARFVTAPEVTGVIEETLASKVAQWKPLYGHEVPDEPVRPEPLKVGGRNFREPRQGSLAYALPSGVLWTRVRMRGGGYGTPE